MQKNTQKFICLIAAMFLGVWIGEVKVGFAHDDPPAAEMAQLSWTFTVLGLTCENCANSAEQVLQKEIPGIGLAEVDFASKKGTIQSEHPVTKREIRQALATLGFEVVFADDPAAPAPLSQAEVAELDVSTISHGDKVDFVENLAPGKYTIFDYYADWCGPCHLLSPKLEQLVADNEDIALRKIDVVNWETEAARQATTEFSMPGLPYVRVYGPTGDYLGSVYGNELDKILILLERKES